MSSWSIEPSVFDGVVEEDLAKLRTKIALDAHRGIVFRTPVKSGRARGSWAISYSAPIPQDMIATTGQALSKGFQQLAKRSAEPYAKVVISSSLPYIRKLENGSSQQAPGGMVALTMARLNAKYK